MKIRDSLKSYTLLFLIGILAGIICRLSDALPYDSLWSLSSIATLFGFWIASVSLITYFSSSNHGAFFNSLLYLFGMTLSFYGLAYILGFFLPAYAHGGSFPVWLFLRYAMLSLVCGLGSFVLYCWNINNWFGSFLYALPASGLLAEGVGCLYMLIYNHILLGQTIFDLAFALLFGIMFFRKAGNRILYLASMAVVTIAVFWWIYKPVLFIF